MAGSCLAEVWIDASGSYMGLTPKTDTNEDADHHYLLFSATFKPELRRVAKKFLANDHIRIRIGRAGSTHGNVKQVVSHVDILWPQNPTDTTVGRLSGSSAT